MVGRGMTTIDRRVFLMGMAGATALAGANERVNLAVIGLGARGLRHIKDYAGVSECRIAAVCDIDAERLERGQAAVQAATGSKPKAFSDLRKLYEDKSIDAVSIATCNHWHALATIWACQAGKDVYVEKPASHNIFEGRKMVEAARKYGRMVQVGSQGRSLAHRREAIERLREGAIGRVYLAKGLCFKRRKSIGHKPDSPVPPGVDYDLWCGPAEKRPFNANRFHYNWHWFWNTGNGDIGNQGVHEMDFALWGLGKDHLPPSVISTGGKYIYDDDQETPNTQFSVFDFGDCQLQFEVRGLLTGTESSVTADGDHFIGNIFYGSEGYMAVDVNGYRVFRGEKRELQSEVPCREAEKWDNVPHMRNFLDAVRSRKAASLNTDIEIGQRAAALCHMANISYRTGRKLQFDAQAERFVSDQEANRLLKRAYRSPFLVPDKV
jgi:predicted dehydrogenase